MNYLVNYRDVVYNLSPWFIRKAKWMNYLYALIRPLKELNSDLIYTDYNATLTYAVGDLVHYQNINYKCKTAIAAPESFTATKWINLGRPNAFYPYYQKVKHLLQFNAQIINLEQYLNDIFDSSNRGIYIDNGMSSLFYVYQVAEAIPHHVFNIYNSVTTYSINEYTDFGGVIYKSLQNANAGNTPYSGSIWWEVTEYRSFMYNIADTTIYDYVIHVPLAVTFDQSNFQSHVNQFNLASKRYAIVQ